jgi:hypothetical protein
LGNLELLQLIIELSGLLNARTIMDTIIYLLKEAPKDIAKNEIH